MRRRRFLRSTLGAGAGLLLPAGLLGCDGATPGPDAGPRIDAFVPDTGPLPITRDITKGPYVQLLGPASARLRVETRFDEPLSIAIERAGGTSTPEALRIATELDYARDFGIEGYLTDDAGLHVLHEIVLEDLSPGELVRWTATPSEGEPRSGSFRAPVAPGSAFRLGWLADTSFPSALNGIAVLATQAPDVVIHGGDITYYVNPLDTWNGMAAGMRPLFERAPVHYCVGNHEFEAMDEISAQFDRLFSGQGDRGGAPRYFAFTYGAVRLLCIDTESGDLATMDEPQLAWLDAELAAVDASAELRFAIAAFHRPTYTLSKHAPSNTVVRDLLHSRFVAHGVPLVLSGHAHCYERFVVDGIHYVIDGGGGAALYDPDEDRDAVEALRPGETALRQAVSMSRGVTTVDVAESGELRIVRRAAEDGAVQDEATIVAA